MLNLSKERLLIIIALSLAGVSLVTSLVFSFQVVKLKQDLTHQSFPTPTPTLTPAQTPTTQPTIIPSYPTPTPSPKPESTFPTEYSCNTDSDCVLKDRPYCCGEKLEYYKWCYHKDVVPEVISCKGVGSCPGLVGSAKSCVCQNGKCVAIFAETQTNPSSSLHKPCGPNDQCSTGQKCISYYGIAGPRGPLFKTCEIPCPNGDADCPTGFTCFAIADGPGLVCDKTP